MTLPPMDRKRFLAKTGRALGGVLLAGVALNRIRADTYRLIRTRSTTKVVKRFSGARLDLLKEACESGDFNHLISLLHRHVQWWGANRNLPGQRAPA